MGDGRVLVTGSAGHLGEALVRVLREEGREGVGVDVLDSPFTTVVGSIADRDVVLAGLRGVDAVLHAATLHKPHVGSHNRQAFIDTNITGTLMLLEEAVAAAEHLCELVHRDHGLPVVVLRTSRFFPEPDDRAEIRDRYPDANVKANEYLARLRADDDPASPLARTVGAKGYHRETTGVYTSR